MVIVKISLFIDVIFLRNLDAVSKEKTFLADIKTISSSMFKEVD